MLRCCLVWLGVLCVQGVFLVGYSEPQPGQVCVNVFIDSGEAVGTPSCISALDLHIIIPSATVDHQSKTYFLSTLSTMNLPALNLFNSTSNIFLSQLTLVLLPCPPLFYSLPRLHHRQFYYIYPEGYIRPFGVSSLWDTV